MSVVQRMASKGGTGQGPAGKNASMMVPAFVGKAHWLQMGRLYFLARHLKGFAWHKMEIITS